MGYFYLFTNYKNQMKKLFSFKRLEVSIVKGFLFGMGIDNFGDGLKVILFVGPFTIEVYPPAISKVKNINQF